MVLLLIYLRRLPGEDNLHVRWVKPDIHVLEHTVIKPPYSEDDVHHKSEEEQALSERDYVRKLVILFFFL